MHTAFWQGNLDERNHLEDLDVGGEIIFKRMLKKSSRKSWTELIWLRLRDEWRDVVNMVTYLRVP
jgi:hypothetical protein